MSEDKKINRKATIQRILNKCNKGIGYSIDVAKFNEKIYASDEKKVEEFLVGAAFFCDVEIVYE